MTEELHNLKEGAKRDCFCGNCRKRTHHTLLKVVTQNVYEDKDKEYLLGTSYYCIVQCDGCSNISFLRIDNPQDMGEYEDESKYYSPISEDTYPIPETSVFSRVVDCPYLPNTILGVYKEAIWALTNKCHNLAAFGFRGALEAFCNDVNAKGSSLDKKVNWLRKMGLISDDTLQMLHAVRLLGNEAVHCAKEYSRNELCVVMDIIESVLYSYYVVLSKGQQMLNMPIAKYGSFVIAINK